MQNKFKTFSANIYCKLSKRLTFIKYLTASTIVYLYILGSMYILVDFFKADKILSYLAVYSTAYFLGYLLSLRLVFKRDHHWKKIVKYLVYIFASLSLSTLLYRFFILININYLLAVILVAIILMPFRYLCNKYWVYR